MFCQIHSQGVVFDGGLPKCFFSVCSGNRLLRRLPSLDLNAALRLGLAKTSVWDFWVAFCLFNIIKQHGCSNGCLNVVIRPFPFNLKHSIRYSKYIGLTQNIPLTRFCPTILTQSLPLTLFWHQIVIPSPVRLVVAACGASATSEKWRPRIFWACILSI